MKYLHGLLALIAGLIGGAASHYLLVQPIRTVGPNVITAEKFVLVDLAGIPTGTFTWLPTGRAPAIVLYDALVREIWRATNSPRPLTLANSN
jgi:hypothetical protein